MTDSTPADVPFAVLPRLSLLVTGGTGFIGTALIRALLHAGHAVSVLSRNPERAARLFAGRIRSMARLEELADDEPFDAVVNLAGAPVVGPRWTSRRKQVLLDSRVGTTEALMSWLRRTARRPAVWVQASAVGFYGVRDPGETLTEDSAAGAGFMAELCQRWEAAASEAVALGVRQVVLRQGLVFGPGGGLATMLLPYRFGLGGRLGDGHQMLSWIHRADLLRIIALALGDARLHGVYNATAPEPVSQAQFALTAGQVLGRPTWLKLPSAPLRLAGGEMAQLFLDGQRVVPERLLESGFEFRFPTLEAALHDLT